MFRCVLFGATLVGFSHGKDAPLAPNADSNFGIETGVFRYLPE